MDALKYCFRSIGGVPILSLIHISEFKVKDIEGQEWSKADVTGRPMVLNFWYTG